MKVILAGVSKTGTKSMMYAFKELGMNVYDFMENYAYLYDDWIKISTKGATTDDFQRMFQGVDAVTDTPVWYYWEELLKAFPDVKIVLTVRNEETWLKSFEKQVESLRLFLNLKVILRILSPTFYKLTWFSNTCALPMFKLPPRRILGISIVERLNELLLRKIYRRHNSYVIRTAPKDQLLIYDLNQGWEPLCKFLGVDVPSTPFPHINKNASLTTKMIATDPVILQVKRELTVSLTVFSALLAFGCYKLAKSFSSVCL